MTKEQTQSVLSLINFEIERLKDQLERHVNWNTDIPKNRQTDLTAEITEFKSKISHWIIIHDILNK